MNEPALLFVDTEFTSLGEAGTPELISLAACALDGREFYLEADEFDPARLSDFTRSNVVPLLERGSKAAPFAQIPPKFQAFVQSFGSPCVVACDSLWDWAWLNLVAAGEQRLRPYGDDPSKLPFWPSALCPRRFHLDWDALPDPAWTLAGASLDRSFAERMPHHALVDARANRDAFLEACSGLGIDPRDFSALCGPFSDDDGLADFVSAWILARAIPADR